MVERDWIYKRRFGIIVLLFIVCFLGSFLLGRYPVYPDTLLKLLLSVFFPMQSTWTAQAETVVFQVRLPRVFMAALIGGGLSCAGAA